jgi:hypothetical protein
MFCSRCGGTMKAIAFLTDYSVVDRIINHLRLTFVADRPPPPQVAFQEYLMAAKTSAKYFPDPFLTREEKFSRFSAL